MKTNKQLNKEHDGLDVAETPQGEFDPFETINS